MTDKQPDALLLADLLTINDTPLNMTAAAELRRLHEVNAELVEIFKRIRHEKGFACECGIEDATWELIESAIEKLTGK
jgi:hypothetical protein